MRKRRTNKKPAEYRLIQIKSYKPRIYKDMNIKKYYNDIREELRHGN